MELIFRRANRHGADTPEGHLLWGLLSAGPLIHVPPVGHVVLCPVISMTYRLVPCSSMSHCLEPCSHMSHGLVPYSYMSHVWSSICLNISMSTSTSNTNVHLCTVLQYECAPVHGVPIRMCTTLYKMFHYKFANEFVCANV